MMLIIHIIISWRWSHALARQSHLALPDFVANAVVPKRSIRFMECGGLKKHTEAMAQVQCLQIIQTRFSASRKLAILLVDKRQYYCAFLPFAVAVVPFACAAPPPLLRALISASSRLRFSTVFSYGIVSALMPR